MCILFFSIVLDKSLDSFFKITNRLSCQGLAMSRSLCDGVAHTAGVSSEPEFYVYEFNKGREDQILVMASDGLWEFMSNQVPNCMPILFVLAIVTIFPILFVLTLALAFMSLFRKFAFSVNKISHMIPIFCVCM